MKYSTICCFALLASCVGAQEAQGHWKSWRGENGTGAGRGKPPITWAEGKNVRWKVQVGGRGVSSPIVFGDRVYVTTAVETDRSGPSTALEAHDKLSTPPPTNVHAFAVVALDRATGKSVWRRVVKETIPHEGGHKTNSQAAGSPVTDGERLYVDFGSRGLYCLGFDGKVLWSKDLGLMRTRHQYGEGASPAVYGDTLVVLRDQEGDSFIAAFDKRTGRPLWRKKRDEVTGWSTPLIVDVDNKPQVITTATGASRAYDLSTGEERWSLSGMTVNSIPSPIHAEGVAYLMSGWKGNVLQAVRLSGAKGDLGNTPHVAWTHSRNTSYVPSALLYGDCIYFLRLVNGVVTCLDRKTGAVHYEGKRLSGMRRIIASPVGAGGHVYITAVSGTTQVLKHGPEFALAATNQLDDEFIASPALAGNEIYLRGEKHLYCIAHDSDGGR